MDGFEEVKLISQIFSKLSWATAVCFQVPWRKFQHRCARPPKPSTKWKRRSLQQSEIWTPQIPWNPKCTSPKFYWKQLLKHLADILRVISAVFQFSSHLCHFETFRADFFKLPRKDILELRNFGSPPSLVLMVMEMVALLFGSPTDWSAAKTLISENNFGKRFKAFKKVGKIQKQNANTFARLSGTTKKTTNAINVTQITQRTQITHQQQHHTTPTRFSHLLFCFLQTPWWLWMVDKRWLMASRSRSGRTWLHGSRPRCELQDILFENTFWRNAFFFHI